MQVGMEKEMGMEMRTGLILEDGFFKKPQIDMSSLHLSSFICSSDILKWDHRAIIDAPLVTTLFLIPLISSRFFIASRLFINDL